MILDARYQSYNNLEPAFPNIGKRTKKNCPKSVLFIYSLAKLDSSTVWENRSKYGYLTIIIYLTSMFSVVSGQVSSCFVGIATDVA